MDDGTRDAAADAINEARLSIQQALDYLDHPDSVLALASAVVQLHRAILFLECPVEE